MVIALRCSDDELSGRADLCCDADTVTCVGQHSSERVSQVASEGLERSSVSTANNAKRHERKEGRALHKERERERGQSDDEVNEAHVTEPKRTFQFAYAEAC